MNLGLSTPHWHLHDFSSQQQQATLLQLDEPDYRAASFLDQRVEALAKERRELALRDLQDALPAAARPTRCIFHLGHCGSTLLSRALSASPNILPLREPLTLRRLAAEPTALHLLPLVMAAHSRVFHPAQVVVIKASSTCNRLIEPVLRSHAESQAILMYVPLETYLAGMLGKLTSPSDLSAQAESRLADWQSIPGAPALANEQLNTTKLAVLAWLTGMHYLLAAAGHHPVQTLLCNFETLLNDPQASLTECASFMGLQAENQVILSGWPDISTSYSKQPDLPYSAFNRRKTLHRGRLERGDDIRDGISWAQSMMSALVAPANGLSLKLFIS